MTSLASRFLALTVFMVVVSSQPSNTFGAELELRRSVDVNDNIVYLRDIAKIRSNNPSDIQTLGNLALFPAPMKGRQISLRAQAVLDWLQLRGIRLNEHQIKGATTVTIRHVSSARKFSPTKSTPTTVGRGQVQRRSTRPFVDRYSAVMARQAHSRIERAILLHLQSQVDARAKWAVKVSLTPQQAAQIPPHVDQIEVTGGVAPFNNVQEFEIRIRGVRSVMKVNAEVKLPPRIVVTTRRIPVGATLQAGDLTLSQTTAYTTASRHYEDPSQLIGKETTRALAIGQVITNSAVRERILIRRNAPIVVYARTSGVTVSTIGKALDQGAMNQVIRVAPTNGTRNEVIMARVIGTNRAELFVASTTYGTNQRPRVSSQRSTGQRSTGQRSIPRRNPDGRRFNTRIQR